MRHELAALTLGCALAAAHGAAADDALVLTGDPYPDHVVIAVSVPDARSVTWRIRTPGGARWRTRTERRVSAGDAPVAGGDDVAQADLGGLLPGTTYEYEVWAEDPGARSSARRASGRVTTAPSPSAAVAVRFAWGGDLGGQNLCRPAGGRYPIFDALNRERLDFFIGLGDMIYADGACEARGKYGDAQEPVAVSPARSLQDFRARWRYQFSDPGLRALVARAPYVAVWDDHEVENDFDSADALMPMGLRAFLEYSPIAARPGNSRRLYRSFTFGRNLQVFVLDLRQYRDLNAAVDSAEKPKTMLGREQRDWLLRELQRSRATWKIIISSVSLSIPTVGPNEARPDGWANGATDKGFERELVALVQRLHASRVRNLVWLATDVHFATGFRERPISGDPGWTMYEFESGPMNAGLFPNRRLDDTLAPERLFFLGPESAETPRSLEEARRYFNYGVVAIDAAGRLSVGIRDVSGQPVYELALTPQG
jgi:alkaline phosphatase D